ncbi:hypothetical protein Dimus_013802 [Dionaea muscipula]
MYEVADVDEEEGPTEGIVGGTQESEDVASNTKSKPKAKPKKKVVVSPAVRENVVGEVEGDKAVEEEIEETQTDEDVRKLVSDSDVNKKKQTRKRRQIQGARTGPAAKKAKTDIENVSPVEEEIEPIKEPGVFGSPTIAELDQQVDELLARPFIS